MPVVGNMGQVGKKGAYEILGYKVTKDKEGLIHAEAPAKPEKAAEEVAAETETKKVGRPKKEETAQ